MALAKLYPVLLEFKKVQTAAGPESVGQLAIGNQRASTGTTEKRMEEV